MQYCIVFVFVCHRLILFERDIVIYRYSRPSNLRSFKWYSRDPLKTHLWEVVWSPPYILWLLNFDCSKPGWYVFERDGIMTLTWHSGLKCPYMRSFEWEQRPIFMRKVNQADQYHAPKDCPSMILIETTWTNRAQVSKDVCKEIGEITYWTPLTSTMAT